MDNDVRIDILHSGVAHDENPPGRGSGRFGWGTGENPNQHQFTFLSEVERLKKNGYSEDEIAKILISPNSKASELRTTIFARTSISTAQVKKLREQGKTEQQIAKQLLGDYASVNDLKAKLAIAEKRERQEMCNKVTELYSKTITEDNPQGNKSEVARQLGIRESSVRGYLNEARAEKTNKYWNTADLLKRSISKSPTGIIDVSKNTEIELGVTENTKKVAIALLQEEGYVKSWVRIPQMGTHENTTMMVLAAPPKDGETLHDVMVKIQKNKLDISTIKEYSPDGGSTFFVPERPSSMSSDRIYIRRASQGGSDKDGVIEIRPGVEDLSLGESHYAQVRIAVDGTHYMKGMAIYSKDIPKGYDVVYNTSKPDDWPMMGPDKNKEILKRLKDDPDNPFGANIKAGGQSFYKDNKGEYVAEGDGFRKATKADKGLERYSLSPVNKLQEEGDWDKWSRNLSSQFLSKQPIKLINQQLDLSIKSKRAEFDEIMSLTNPVIKKQLLGDFAEQCDKTASDLSAKGVKGQAFQVILPVTGLKDTEIYAPNFKNGDTVALVRYPHSGIFEIPVLKVNNNNQDGKDIIGISKDAVGINPKVASVLSGADFDGDTVVVIPTKSNNLTVASRKPFEDLKPEKWDFHNIYRLPDNVPAPKDSTKQMQMGMTTNLIMDMTLAGAPDKDILKAVKHSMVVIDCVKHRLDWKQSEKDNDIIALKKYWQGENSMGGAKGASTIITKAGSEDRTVHERKEITRLSDMTPEEVKIWQSGRKVYRDTDRMITKERIKDPAKMTPEELDLYSQGKKIYRELKKPKYATQSVKKMDLTDDARTLVRNPNNLKEMAYANYANALKDIANQARREYRAIKPQPVDQVAKKTYKKEVDDLKAKLLLAKSNSPKERQAQRLANKIVNEKIKCNPELEFDSEHLSREKGRALNAARAAVGASKKSIFLTDDHWKAIQSNALSTHTVSEILLNSDKDRFRELATPKQRNALSPAKVSLAQSMVASGMYTYKEIADKLGISISTLHKYV
ncbi:MAG: helix-turn-helix domain-containing protein [Pseudobutyrivibrio sp.]|nr:helix-turn-helix domain-containing protein [Pseudobutyrivibrio sp.]